MVTDGLLSGSFDDSAHSDTDNLFDRKHTRMKKVVIMEAELRDRHPRRASYADDTAQYASAEIESKGQSIGWICVRLSSSALCGIVFGFALEKGRVFEPQVITDQMLFVRFVMLKMFLSASATSMFCFSVLSMLPATHEHMARAMREFASCLRTKGVMSSVVGGAIMGAGMTLSGACPGMVLVQAGAGTPNALVTLLGGVSGVLLYALVEPYMVKITRPRSPIQMHYLHQHLGGPYFTLALPCMAVMAMMVFGAELYSPWTSEVVVRGEGVFRCLSWPPYLAGMLVGLIQIPVVLLNHDTLGSSTSYCSLVSQPFRINFLQKMAPYLNAYRSGAHNWWQVCYVGGAVAGAYLSSWLSGSHGQTPGVTSAALTFVGGACMLFGSRLAAGCTSGHGLSGMGMLSLVSLVAVPAMFAGGIATAVLTTVL